ncbi:propanediol/glycerol family dehydratase large subunit [Chelativorans sp. Marseille-P2723]|uniref:propanediol/glycerol family dehydratase large subunit n=1 Tax=Chelativorans sp. Marseille-P2723 TaxID=2709133 RepID=UPI001570D4E4|nr:propanediol/glycerol family dehydratase large subunit [Chelativorans sp. Marseille-P2723]
MTTPPRWRRFDEWDTRALRHDQFAAQNSEAGFSTFQSPWDPAPSARLENGRIVEIDGKPEAEFDIIDSFIATHFLDPDIVEEAMAMDSTEVARLLVDINVPRERLERLACGMTPAKLVSVVSVMSALEITFAYAKMRQRRTPGNQAHVTNAKDDPLQLAADAATAVALGFDEIETTMRVASNSWANAMACAVGAAVGRGGVLFQCSIEEAEELQIGMAGFTSYAETVSVYGTEAAFVDGDDTPWSKAFLTAAYASRGIKTRCTSGASAELLMGFHERKSVLYLEARCLCLQSAMGVQGTQNGGIDGAPLTASMASGMRELMAENLIAVWLGLECASGNDTRVSESEIRVGAKITPYLLAGSDLLCSGFGSIKKYDNSFNPSLFNGEEIEDYLALQRDFEVDGGLTPLDEEETGRLRMRAIEAVAAVFDELGLAEVKPEWMSSVAAASGSLETETFSPGEVTRISNKIRDRRLTALDVVRALARRGFEQEAENLMLMLRQRISGDYLQTSAILRDGKVISAINDPNHYSGPATGYNMTPERWEKVQNVRDLQTIEKVMEHEAPVDPTAKAWLVPVGTAGKGKDAHEVVVGLSPAFGVELTRTTAGHDLIDVVLALTEGIRDGGGVPRLVRIRHTADTSFLGLTAARLSGSGYGIGIQAKGTAVIHKADRLPHLNVELFSNSPVTTLDHYRAMGRNAALYTHGESPEPVLVPVDGRSLAARYHVRVSMLYAIETSLVEADASPVEVVMELGQGAMR